MSRGLGLLAPALAVLSAGCVYFNTFYNAERYYAEGERLVRVDGRGEEVPPAARTAFEKAVEKASTVLTSHADSKYVDDALLLLGKAHAHLGNHAEAALAFETLVRDHPESELREAAVLGLARSAREAGDVAAAARAVEELSGAAELSREERFQADLEAAGLALGRDEGGRARALLEELQAREPDLARRHDVDLALARARLAAGDPAGALGQLRSALASATQPERQRRAAEAMADVLAASGSGPEARSAYRELLQQGLPDSLAATVQAALAASHAEAGEAAAAVEAYAEAARLLPSSALAASALYHRGLLEWREQQRREAARETFLEAFLQAPETPVADSAATAARTIGEIEHYQRIVSGSERVPSPLPQEEVLATATYLLAELLYTAENDEAGARRLFEEMLTRYPRSEWTPKVLYTLGWMDANGRSGGASAPSPHDERLLREFPGTEYAMYARQRRGDPAPTVSAGSAPPPPPSVPEGDTVGRAGQAAPDSVAGGVDGGPARPALPDAAPAEGAGGAAAGALLALPDGAPAAGSAPPPAESLDARLLAFTRALPGAPDPLLGIEDRLVARQRERAAQERESNPLAAEIARERAATQAQADSAAAPPPPPEDGVTPGSDVLQGEQRPDLPPNRDL